MLRMLVTFVPVAALLTLTPGAATALVVRSAVRDGRRGALRTTAGNSLGILLWGVLAAAGVAAVVAASAAVFTTVKLVGAVVLIVLGIQAWRGGRRPGHGAAGAPRAPAGARAVREALVSSLANPKLAVFFVALFPQFVPAGAPVLPAALLMVAIIVCFDVAWFSVLAWLVGRAHRAFVQGAWLRRVERLTGVVLIGLGLRLAAERR